VGKEEHATLRARHTAFTFSRSLLATLGAESEVVQAKAWRPKAFRFEHVSALGNAQVEGLEVSFPVEFWELELVSGNSPSFPKTNALDER
jgi:hypothetical protein